MAIDHYGSPNGPFYPFGLITVAAAGTPVPLYQNFTAQQLLYLSTGTSEYSLRVNQLWVLATATNTGNIYLISPGGSKNVSNSILFVIPPGGSFFINVPAIARNTIGMNDLTIDADTGGNTVRITGMING